jgi:hypothetical protein
MLPQKVDISHIIDVQNPHPLQWNEKVGNNILGGSRADPSRTDNGRGGASTHLWGVTLDLH